MTTLQLSEKGFHLTTDNSLSSKGAFFRRSPFEQNNRPEIGAPFQQTRFGTGRAARRCTKPDAKEFKKIAVACAIGSPGGQRRGQERAGRGRRFRPDPCEHLLQESGLYAGILASGNEETGASPQALLSTTHF